jgi:hypothetical protein
MHHHAAKNSQAAGASFLVVVCHLPIPKRSPIFIPYILNRYRSRSNIYGTVGLDVRSVEGNAEWNQCLALRFPRYCLPTDSLLRRSRETLLRTVVYRHSYGPPYVLSVWHDRDNTFFFWLTNSFPHLSRSRILDWPFSCASAFGVANAQNMSR